MKNKPTNEPEDENICPATGKEHVPDWGSITVNFDGEHYVDVNCANCGRSGCVGTAETLAENINW